MCLLKWIVKFKHFIIWLCILLEDLEITILLHLLQLELNQVENISSCVNGDNEMKPEQIPG